MTYALMALMAVRELYTHAAKRFGWKPTNGSRRGHELNGGFAFGVLLVSLGMLLSVRPMATAGWICVGAVFAGVTTAPCSLGVVNRTPVLWYLRQLFFLSCGAAVIAYALGVL